MDNDQIDDLKQFITAATSQQTADIREDVAGVKEDLAEVKKDLAEVHSDLSRRIDQLSADAGEAIDKNNEETELTLINHDKRITRLEKKAA